MQSSLLSFAVPAPKRAQRDGTLHSDDRRAQRVAETERLGLTWSPPRNFGSVSGAGRRSRQTMWEERMISTVWLACTTKNVATWWSPGTALTGEEILRHGMADVIQEPVARSDETVVQPLP